MPTAAVSIKRGEPNWRRRVGRYIIPFEGWVRIHSDESFTFVVVNTEKKRNVQFRNWYNGQCLFPLSRLNYAGLNHTLLFYAFRGAGASSHYVRNWAYTRIHISLVASSAYFSKVSVRKCDISNESTVNSCIHPRNFSGSSWCSFGSRSPMSLFESASRRLSTFLSSSPDGNCSPPASWSTACRRGTQAGIISRGFDLVLHHAL